MTDLQAWQTGNDEYLSAAVSWVRLRLERQRGPLETRAAGDGRWFRWRSTPMEPAQVKDLRKATNQLSAAEKMDPPPALLILQERLGLSDFERNLLLLCAAVELDTRVAGLCAQAQDNLEWSYPTFALAMALFDNPDWEAISPERPLRRWRLVEINQPGARPLTTSPLRADERIVNYLKGLNYLDDRLTPLLVPFDAALGEFNAEGRPVHLPPSQEAVASRIAQSLQQPSSAGKPPLVQLVGPDGVSKQLVAAGTAKMLDLTLFRMPAESLHAQVAEVDDLARLWERESALLPIALYLDAQEADEALQSEKSPLRRFLLRSRGVFLLSSREIWMGLGPASVVFDVEKPAPVEQQAAWQVALGEAELAGRLAGQFNLNLPAIEQAAQEARQQVELDPQTSLEERVWNACLVHTRPRLDVLAQRIDVKATWQDIVLPETELALLHQIADQVEQRSQVYDGWGFREKMNRGLGISALFAGESGTGKTMGAEVIASELRLNLYRIDLSAVVSKYIGETEKNLRRLFDAAEDGGAILFFDEADALFGKRSEVKDSHDRYANIETNYLLQRMESYRGLAILATNMKSALDPAFLRRLRFIVNFPYPNREERECIWQRVFPARTPVRGLDFAFLSRLSLTGGNIHNIALKAAFMAAKAGAPVTMGHVLEAARFEFRKIGQPANEGLLRWQAPAVTEPEVEP